MQIATPPIVGCIDCERLGDISEGRASLVHQETPDAWVLGDELLTTAPGGWSTLGPECPHMSEDWRRGAADAQARIR
jgi:hypothetical protein